MSSNTKAKRGRQEVADLDDDVESRKNRSSSSSRSSDSADSSRNEESETFKFSISKDDLDVNFPFLKLSTKDTNAWDSLSIDVKNICIKSVVRYVIFRANRNESIARTTFAEIIGKVDESYKKYLNPCLFHANQVLVEQFAALSGQMCVRITQKTQLCTCVLITQKTLM